MEQVTPDLFSTRVMQMPFDPPKPRVRLFHAPYVDENGSSRQRLCAAVLGIDAEDDEATKFLSSLRSALEQCESKATVLALDDSFGDIGWL